MKHMPRLALSLEKDVDNGKVFLEDEHEFYVQFDNFDFLKNAESMDIQKQWSPKVEKTPKNESKGQNPNPQVQKSSGPRRAKEAPKRPGQVLNAPKADPGKGPGKR